MRPSTLVLLGGLSGNAIARGIPAKPTTTAAPDPALVELRLRQGLQGRDIDPFSLARVLLTALPPSLIGVAFTNPAAVPSILWQQFLDQSTPAWFKNLPPDIKTYLSSAYLGGTATPVPASATASLVPSPASSASVIRPPPSDPPPSFRSSSQQAPTSTRLPSGSTRANPTSSLSVSTSARSSLSKSADASSSTSETTSPTSLSTVTSPSSKAKATTTSDPVPLAPEASPEPSGLSTGSKILIGVGVPLALLAIIAIAVFTIRARRRRRQRGKRLSEQPPPAFLSAAQLHGDRSGGAYGMAGGFGEHSNHSSLLIPYPPPATYSNDLPSNPFRDPPSNVDHFPEQQMTETTPFVWPNAQTSQPPPQPPLRTQRQSLNKSALEAITEVPDDSPPVLRMAGGARQRGSRDLPPISPVTPPSPQYPPYYEAESTLQHPALRQNNGSGNSLRNSYSQVPVQTDFAEDSVSSLPSSHTSTSSVRRKSLPQSSMGYRGLPSPHLQAARPPLQRLPRGEYIDDSEIWPLRG